MSFMLIFFALVLSIVYANMVDEGNMLTNSLDDWQGRSIYFVVTDRFASLEELPNCSDQSKEWCGGTFDGLISKIPYIKSMGFDAVWITPPVKQVEWRDVYNGTGYHGYWAENFMEIDPHLGGGEGLKKLSDALHEMDMLLMVDIVANHVGPVHSIEDVAKFPSILGSEDGTQYNKLNMTDDMSLDEYIKSSPPNAMSDAGDCWPYYNFEVEVCDREVVENGWFGDLGDLNQGDEVVREYLLEWIGWLRDAFKVDGFRLDTALYIPRDFLSAFQDAADVYIIGEVVMRNFTLHASYQEYLTGVLNFPITEQLCDAFKGSLKDLNSLITSSRNAGYKDRNLLGNFVDNHDGERFLHRVGGDISVLKNALCYTMLSEGVPVVYYGTEVEAVAGNEDNRVGMWEFGYDSEGEIGLFLRAMNLIRRDYGMGFGGEFVRSEMEVVGVKDDWFVFVRGNVAAFVNKIGGGKGGRRECFEGLKWGEGWRVLYGEGLIEEGKGVVCVEVGDRADPIVAARA